MSYVKYEQQGAVAILTIERPEALNALNSQVLSDLDEAITKVETADDVHVVILTGAGRSFVAGADIGEMVNFSAYDGKKFGVHGGSVFLRLENMSKPVIAAINGFALGGGCELTLACDIRVAAENARFALPEVGLGIIPGGGGTQRLSRIIGVGRAKELIFTCDQVDAQEAYRLGLANHVVPLPELMDYCMAMAKKIASKASYAVSVAKAAINTSENVDLPSGCAREQDLLGLLFATHDKKEGMEAFLERRKPHFTDF